MSKRLFIVVEGQTEQEFVNEVLYKQYFYNKGIYPKPILIRTSSRGRGGFVNYEHLKNTIIHLLNESSNNDFIVTTFIDFFRIPTNMPKYEDCMSKSYKDLKIKCLENALAEDINDSRFLPYIQKHEFESLLFANNYGFNFYFSEDICSKTQKIIDDYPNPEDINSTPNGAPSKRILSIMDEYDKVFHGSLIALHIGIDAILEKCPHFKEWINTLTNKCK